MIPGFLEILGITRLGWLVSVPALLLWKLSFHPIYCCFMNTMDSRSRSNSDLLQVIFHPQLSQLRIRDTVWYRLIQYSLVLPTIWCLGENLKNWRATVCEKLEQKQFCQKWKKNKETHVTNIDLHGSTEELGSSPLLSALGQPTAASKTWLQASIFQVSRPNVE